MTATERQEAVTRMRQDGHSIRAIAKALGVTKYQVERDLQVLSGQVDTPPILDDPLTPTPTVHFPPQLYIAYYRRLPSILAGERAAAMITNLPSPAPQATIDALEAIAAPILSPNGVLSVRVGEDPTVIAHTVERLTKPPDLVVDLCVGTSTVADACSRLGRRFVGLDTNEKAVYAVMKRLKGTPR